MKENKNFLLVGILIAVMLVGVVAAQNEIITPTIGDNLFDRIVSSITYLLKGNTFTIYGREMQCSSNPDKDVQLTNTILSGTNRNFYFNSNPCNGQSYFADYFRGVPGNDQYINENYYSKGIVYITDGNNAGWSSPPINPNPTLACDAGAFWNNKCHVQVYCCSNGACSSNSDCSLGETCSKTAQISLKFPQLGICQSLVQDNQTQSPSHTTKVYQCNSDGNNTYLKDVSSTDINYCLNPSMNNYLTIGGTSSGVCYASANQPCMQNTAVLSLADFKKVSLTTDEIIQKTSTELISSACYQSSECLGRANYTTSCVSLSKLKSDGHITQSTETSVFNTANKVLNSAVNGAEIGAGLGLLVCLGATAATVVAPPVVFVTSTVIAASCGSVILGGTIAGAAIATNSQIKYKETDPLVKALKASDDSQVGICTAESNAPNFFDQFAFTKITGNKSTDGMIIFFGGIVLILFILSMLGGKK